ncbi:hypothetical protein QAD02_024216 [Eretmocerus hayati]|uniref:Uncharacterized protein n=1 Tax=Eretmocerus hayati TaxID=131215 RepID=A0ACC2Q096_9HYME|nr:hypothetical protein QAD02_024216 [Eretmocerus hayati]
MGKRKHSLGFRLLLALAIPTLYCLYSSLAGVGVSRRPANDDTASAESRAGLLGELSLKSEAAARLRANFVGSVSRQLLQVNENDTELVLESSLFPRENCTPPSINEFPSDGLTREQRQQGYILIHVLVAVYSFLLLAIICDDFFVPSISKICERISVTKDVAGATFMAVASSSPELFINIVGTFVTEGDLGVGTIVGSAVFNILAVPACCGLFAAQALDLEWWPVSRDSVAYGITVLLLIVTLKDGRIEWWEAFILVFTYVLYILAMCFNTRISTHMNLLVSKRRRRKYRRLSEKTPLIGRDNKFPDTLMSSKSIKSCDSFFAPAKPGDKLYQDANCNTIVQIESLESSEEMDIVNMTSWPDSGLQRCWWILTWPINLALLITIPDCRRPGMKNWYPLTFLMCIVWIALMSYIVGWDITIIGDTLQIPDSVMGLTFLAAGMSVPEAVSSVIVTNKGDGTMGISNSIGSNVFDVLLCLGLPWLVKSTLFPTVKGEHFVQINSEGLIYSSVSLMSTLMLLYGTLALNRFRLDRKVGLICLAMYSVFLVFASLVELNVFFVVNRPTCTD